jgi:hypothetical protein
MLPLSVEERHQKPSAADLSQTQHLFTCMEHLESKKKEERMSTAWVVSLRLQIARSENVKSFTETPSL